MTNADIRRALAREEFEVDYQPLVAIAAGRISAVEALVRWQHPRHGRLTPDAFLPIAERSGAIVDIDRLVLRRACRDMASWRRLRSGPLRVAVNMSIHSLAEPGLAEWVLSSRTMFDLEAGQLELEVTESADLADGSVVVETLNELRASGVEIALDDFGTGYSVLDRLRVLPFDALKIDRAFVAGAASPEGSQLVVAAIAFGRALGLRVVGEGVETTRQLGFLAGLGCDEAQGYLLGRPVSAEGIHRQMQVPGQELPDIPTGTYDLLSHQPAALERIVRPLLGELARLTDLESTYLTLIDRARDQQVILYARNSGELKVGEGLTVPWMDTVCKRSLESGVRCTSDVARDFGESQSGRDLGLRSYAGVPIYGQRGTVWGTLCGASRSPRNLGEATLTMMDAFARLIASQLRLDGWRVPPAAFAAGPAAPRTRSGIA